MLRQKGTNWKLVLCAFAFVGIVASGLTPPVAQTPKPALKQYVKKDGTLDSRKDDLDELCKDWVYYKAKSYKLAREGKNAEANVARVSLSNVNGWLSAYPESDVSAVCATHDTLENNVNYMR